MDLPKSDKVIDYQARQLTYNVYLYLKERKMDPSSTEHANDVNLIDLVAKISGYSKSTVTRVIREGNKLKMEKGVADFKPRYQKRHVRKKRIDVDEYTEGIIRRKVIQFYTVQKEVPSVRKLNTLLRKENILQCSNEYLRQLLHKLGFTNADNESTGMMMERPEIALDRLKYLQRMRIYQRQNSNIFFMSETVYWSLNHETEANKQNMPSIIIVHMSGDTGFLDFQLVMMKSASDVTGDHSQDYKWIKKNVLSNIPAKSVIVMDAPDCEDLSSDQPRPTTPTFSATRGVMQEWLQKHNIPFKLTAQKSTLLEIIQSQSARSKLSLSNLFVKNGHTVIHLPQKHVDLNPTRLVWDKIRQDSRGTNPFVLFQRCSKKKWQSCFTIVKAHESEYYEHDMNIDEAVDSLKVAIKEEVEQVEVEEYILENGDEDVSDVSMNSE